MPVEPARGRVDFEQAMDRFRLNAGRLGKSFRRSARGRTEQASHFLGARISRMELTRVVLPTPGPPVITTTRFARAVFSVSRWLGASILPVLSWHQPTAFSKSIAGKSGCPQPDSRTGPQCFLPLF